MSGTDTFDTLLLEIDQLVNEQPAAGAPLAAAYEPAEMPPSVQDDRILMAPVAESVALQLTPEQPIVGTALEAGGDNGPMPGATPEARMDPAQPLQGSQYDPYDFPGITVEQALPAATAEIPAPPEQPADHQAVEEVAPAKPRTKKKLWLAGLGVLAVASVGGLYLFSDDLSLTLKDAQEDQPVHKTVPSPGLITKAALAGAQRPAGAATVSASTVAPLPQMVPVAPVYPTVKSEPKAAPAAVQVSQTKAVEKTAPIVAPQKVRQPVAVEAAPVETPVESAKPAVKHTAKAHPRHVAKEGVAQHPTIRAAKVAADTDDDVKEIQVLPARAAVEQAGGKHE